jgi:hypothetical protein
MAAFSPSVPFPIAARVLHHDYCLICPKGNFKADLLFPPPFVKDFIPGHRPVPRYI